MTGDSYDSTQVDLYLESTSVYALETTGIFVVNFVWAVILLSKNRNWRRFFRTVGNRSLWYTYFMSALMGGMFADLVLFNINSTLLIIQ